MDNGHNEKSFKEKLEDLKWSFEMYNLYLRQTKIAVKEYNDKLAKLKEVSEVFAPIANDLSKAIGKYAV